MSGLVWSIYICPVAGEPMQNVTTVEALENQGLQGDRYATGNGSWNKGEQGKRQVTFINENSFRNSYTFPESRRNIVTVNIELMTLIGKRFRVGPDAIFEGIKYCKPCSRPTVLSGKEEDFKEVFHDIGGLIAKVIHSGSISNDDEITPIE